MRSVVVEQRHLDADWRSEHGAFHGRLFRRRPSVCHRWHLFTDDVPADLSRLRPEAYRGYVVLRPLPSTPVGRTMIAPPPGLERAVRCEATEKVSLFGTPLWITAMPFLSQDAEYLRCAHATLWMVLRHAHLAHGLPRRLTADVHDAAPDLAARPAAAAGHERADGAGGPRRGEALEGAVPGRRRGRARRGSRRR